MTKRSPEAGSATAAIRRRMRTAVVAVVAIVAVGSVAVLRWTSRGPATEAATPAVATAPRSADLRGADAPPDVGVAARVAVAGYGASVPTRCFVYDALDGCAISPAEARRASGELVPCGAGVETSVAAPGETLSVAARGYAPTSAVVRGGDASIPLTGVEALRLRVFDLAGDPVDGAVVATFPRGPEVAHRIGESGSAGPGAFACVLGRARDLRVRATVDEHAAEIDLATLDDWSDVRLVLPRKSRARLVLELPEAAEDRAQDELNFDPPSYAFSVRVGGAPAESFRSPCPEGRCEREILAAAGDDVTATVELSGGGTAVADGVVRDGVCTLRFADVRRRRVRFLRHGVPLIYGEPIVVCTARSAIRANAEKDGAIPLLTGPDFVDDVYAHAAGRSAPIAWREETVDLGKVAARLRIARDENRLLGYEVVRTKDHVPMSLVDAEEGDDAETWLPPGKYLVRRRDSGARIAEVALKAGDDVRLTDEPPGAGAIVGVAFPQAMGDALELVDPAYASTVRRREFDAPRPFAFRDVPPGEYMLRLGGPESSWLLRPVRVAAGETVDVGRFGNDARTIRLRLVSPDSGAPVVGRPLRVAPQFGGDGPTYLNLRTDDAGYADVRTDPGADWLTVLVPDGASGRATYLVDLRAIRRYEATQLTFPPRSASAPVATDVSWNECASFTVFVPTEYGFAGANAVRAADGRHFARVPSVAAALAVGSRFTKGRSRGDRVVGTAVGEGDGYRCGPWERFDLRAPLAERGVADGEELTLESLGGVRFPAGRTPSQFRLPLRPVDGAPFVVVPADSTGRIEGRGGRVRVVREGRSPPRVETE